MPTVQTRSFKAVGKKVAVSRHAQRATMTCPHRREAAEVATHHNEKSDRSWGQSRDTSDLVGSQHLETVRKVSRITNESMNPSALDVTNRTAV